MTIYISSSCANTCITYFIKGAMTWHAHITTRQASSARNWPLHSQTLGLLLVRHIMMVSVFRSLAFYDSLRRICKQTPLCVTYQNVGFPCALHLSKPHVYLSFEIRAAQSLQCAHMHTF